LYFSGCRIMNEIRQLAAGAHALDRERAFYREEEIR
jgi:hypothetical protein